MQSHINRHQLAQIISHIAQDYETYTVQRDGDTFALAPIKSPAISIPVNKTNPSFKSLIWSNGQVLEQAPKRKIALLGLTNCDALALNLFLETLSKTSLVPSRQDILILSAQCVADETCFCTVFDHKISGYDLYVQLEKSGYSIFSATRSGEKILKENGFKNKIFQPKLRQIQLSNRPTISKNRITEAVDDFDLYQDFWQKIANNCFGCGSCSAVCPLCFCTKREETNDTSDEAKICLKWDACFAKGFSMIQNQYDLRPKRVNRLYNWYHHKFVRSEEHNHQFLCTGCGRCIGACPAHLNQYKIISSISSHEEKNHG